MKNDLAVRVLLVLSAALAANGQNASVQPRFEVASVRRTDQCDFNTSIDPGSMTLKGVPLKMIVMEAFKVKMEQIEGPSWLETECYEIAAKIPQGAPRDQVPAMLQALLTERLRLAAHKEDRQRTGYALVIDKGGLKAKEDDPKAKFLGSHAGQIFLGRAGHGALKGAMTMASLASYLSGRGYGPVEDATGLTGKYDIDLSWAANPEFEPRAREAEVAAAPPPTATDPAADRDLFAALRESLGLGLERRSIPVQFVVIDHIERAPGKN